MLRQWSTQEEDLKSSYPYVRAMTAHRAIGQVLSHHKNPADQKFKTYPVNIEVAVR